MNRGISLLCAVSVMLLVLPGYAGAVGWVLYGNVTDAGTCGPVAGVNVSSTYSTMNLSNVKGGYSISLGTGNGTITAKKQGYLTKTFVTPYETSGALQYSFSILMPGEAPSNCLNGNVITTSVPVTTAATTSVAASSTTTISASPTPPSSGSNYGLALIGIAAVIIIAAAAAYLLTKKGGKGSAPKKGTESHETAAEIKHEIAQEQKAEKAAEGAREQKPQ